jgi:hypothetical protein
MRLGLGLRKFSPDLTAGFFFFFFFRAGDWGEAMATEQGTWVAGLGRRRGYFTGGNLGYKIFGIWVEI